MNQVIAIALGGSMGAVTRFMVANAFYAAFGRGFPIATLFINVTGSFLMGFLAEWLLQRLSLATEYRAAVLVGFLGAYTTFSTFAIETLYLFEGGTPVRALLNIGLSVLLCLAGVWLGILLGRGSAPDLMGPVAGFPVIGSFAIWTVFFLMALWLQGWMNAIACEPLCRSVFYLLGLSGIVVALTLWWMFRLERPPDLGGVLLFLILQGSVGSGLLALARWLLESGSRRL